MLYRLRLVIRYAFAQPTGAGRQLFRILPARLPGLQDVLDERVTLTPAAQEQIEVTDFFGTRVLAVAMPPGLQRLEVTLEARLRRTAPDPGFDMSAPVAELPAQIAACRSLAPGSPHHFLPPSPLLPPSAAITAFARAATAGAPTLRAQVAALGQALHDTMRFDAKATGVDTTAEAAFAGRHGVCQDFSQIMITGLRGLGVPAAYVSGFLRTTPPPGKPRLEGADAMHAWVRVWCGAEAGWIDYDPTNACFVGADHLVLGFGRDYGDVAPVIGQLRLAGGQSGTHTVDLVPEDEAAAAQPRQVPGLRGPARRG